MTNVSLGSTLKVCCQKMLAIPALQRNEMACISKWKGSIQNEKEWQGIGQSRGSETN